MGNENHWQAWRFVHFSLSIGLKALACWEIHEAKLMKADWCSMVKKFGICFLQIDFWYFFWWYLYYPEKDLWTAELWNVLLDYGQGQSLPTNCANPFQPIFCWFGFFISCHPLLANASYLDLFYFSHKGVAIDSQTSSLESTSVGLNCVLRPFFALGSFQPIEMPFTFPHSIWLVMSDVLSSVFQVSPCWEMLSFICVNGVA